MLSVEENPETPPRLRAGGIVLAFLFGLVLFLIIAEIGLRIGMPQWREFYNGRFIERSFVPGYGLVHIGRAGFDGWFAQNNGDFRAHIRINAFGLRNPDPPAAATDSVWVIGDSMTFGWGVESDEMYSEVIASTTKLKTYNIASPGTDVCGYEALLARMPDGPRPTAIVVGLVVENDLRVYDCPRGSGPKTAPEKTYGRSLTLSHVKLFMTNHLALYNVLAVSVKRVPALVNALGAVGLVAEPQRYRRVFGSDEINAVATATADEIAFLKSMTPGNAPFAVLVMPARFDVRDRDPFYMRLREATVAALRARGIDIVDPTEAFREAGFAPTHFIHDGHWSPLGHRIAGEAAADWLRKISPTVQ